MKQKLSISFVLLLSSILSTGLSNESGYNKPLGRHRNSDGHIDIFDEVPAPQEFWDKCIHIQKPCLFRGAGSNFPAKEKWTNEYLIDRFGDLEVKYILGRKEVPANIQKIGKDSMKTFLESYTSEDKHIFSQLPDLMSEDIFVLPFLTCGSYKERLLNSNLWLSSGEKKSSLRYDAENTIHCLLNGTKDWILIHPNSTEHVSLHLCYVCSKYLMFFYYHKHEPPKGTHLYFFYLETKCFKRTLFHPSQTEVWMMTRVRILHYFCSLKTVILKKKLFNFLVQRNFFGFL